MASEILLDTSGWVALLNATDALHAAANQSWKGIGRVGGRRIVLTDWIIAETGNGLARLKRNSYFPTLVHHMFTDSRVDVIYVDQPLLERAMEMYKRHSDKSWGLVDCASFVVMKDRGIIDAFTNDRHLEQAGFNCLLVANPR